MSVIYKEPKNWEPYTRWSDFYGMAYDVWYDYNKIIVIGDNYQELKIPKPIVHFIEKWTEILKEEYKSFREQYPVKHASIQFIYKDEVYELLPETFGIRLYSFFEEFEMKIRKDLSKKLKVIFHRYTGFLD